MLKVLLLSVGIVGLGAVAEPITISVRPEGYAPSPASVTVQVHVTPDKDNRQLDVVLVGIDTEYERLSAISIEGAEARTMHTYYYKDLPEGRYIAIAQLTRVVKGSKAVIYLRAESKELTVTE